MITNSKIQNLLRHSAGFTLIEIMAVMVIIVVLLFVLVKKHIELEFNAPIGFSSQEVNRGTFDPRDYYMPAQNNAILQAFPYGYSCERGASMWTLEKYTTLDIELPPEAEARFKDNSR